ncbi:hypothetical protein DQ354_10775 [Arthrobacter sp. AQ5-06]|nr:hypothetical protein DQ354_10775 [Arthrobacter sp. AQ5-06]
MHGGGAKMFRQLVAPASTAKAHSVTAKARAAQAAGSDFPRLFPMTRLSRRSLVLRKHGGVTESCVDYGR